MPHEVLYTICWLKARFGGRKGQSTVEYLLVMAVIVSVALMGIGLFHKKLMGGFFSIVGMVIGKKDGAS